MIRNMQKIYWQKKSERKVFLLKQHNGSVHKCSKNCLVRLITLISDLSGLSNRPKRSEGYLRHESLLLL